MKKVLIITRTNWNEAPRIRHQITRMFKARGYQIAYIEKNSYRNVFIKHRYEEGIDFYAHAELIHHQLRYFPIIQKLNNAVVRFYLKRIVKKIEYDFVMNFCYEYSFLKKLMPNKKIVTMIEDDFESQAKFAMTAAIRNQVMKTCKNSDAVLTVSYPLLDKLRAYNDNVKMLFPWSQSQYAQPQVTAERNTVLYFGFVHRMEWRSVENLIRDTQYTYRFVGPPGKSHDVQMLNHLKSTYPNFEYIPYSSVNDLRTDDVFCSILPYDPTIKSVQACTISNRAFNLLSLGLPLVYADLHYLIKAPLTVIRKNKSLEEYKISLDYFKQNFYQVQDDIREFLSSNYENDRWNVLKATIDE